MPTDVHALLGGWESFYVIMGSSGAALTGLQFVVVTLIADERRLRPGSARDTGSAISAFGTPTIVHFCAALLISAVLSAPWRSLAQVRVALLLVGAGGIGYTALAIARARRQTNYEPVFEDWLWHAAIPAVAYVALLAGAGLLLRRAEDALFLVAATTLMLLFTGIHNSWDTLTYITVERIDARPAAPPSDRPPADDSVPPPRSPDGANVRR